jgi:hypothetical protein
MGDEPRSGEAFDRAFRGMADILGGLLADIPVHPGSFVRSEAIGEGCRQASEGTA